MKTYDNEVILAFADTHFPYQHKDTYDFLSDIIREYKPDRIIHVGDLLDQYAFSSYPKNPDQAGPTTEISRGVSCVKVLNSILGNSKLDLLESNHDDRIYRKGRVAGIPREMILPYKRLVEAPANWNWHRDLTLTVRSTGKQIYFRHTATGTLSAITKAMGMTTVLAHHHQRQGCQRIMTPRNSIWGVDTGCLISDKGSPYSYNKGNVIRPARGAVVLISGIPIIIPMR